MHSTCFLTGVFPLHICEAVPIHRKPVQIGGGSATVGHGTLGDLQPDGSHTALMEAECSASCVSVSEHSCQQLTSAGGMHDPPPPWNFSGLSEQSHKCREQHGNFDRPSSLRALQRCNICKWRRVQNLKGNMDDGVGGLQQLFNKMQRNKWFLWQPAHLERSEITG